MCAAVPEALVRISCPWSFCLVLHETLKHFLGELVLRWPLERDTSCGVGIRSTYIPYRADCDVHSQQTARRDSSDPKRIAAKDGDIILNTSSVTAMLALGVELM